MTSSRGLVALGLVLASSVVAGGGLLQDATPADWHTFEASWAASGRRQTLPVGEGRTAAIVRLSGALVLSTGEGLSRGFRAELIGFDDGNGSGVGRAVWTDDRGDQIFSDLVGEPAQSGRRIRGSITGGTGRYVGLTGEYAFTWQYVLPGDEAGVQAHTMALVGRYRRESR